MMYWIKYSFFVFFLYLVGPLMAKNQPFQVVIRALEQQEGLKAQKYIQSLPATIQKKYPAQYHYYCAIACHQQILKGSIHSSGYRELVLQAKKHYEQSLEYQKINTQRYRSLQIRLEDLYLFFFNRGVDYYMREAYTRALSYFELCQLFKSTDYLLRLYLAATHHQQGNTTQAAIYYQHLIPHLTDHAADIYYALSVIYHPDKQETWVKADQAIQQALQLQPFNQHFLAQQYQLWNLRKISTSTLAQYEQKIKEKKAMLTEIFHLAYGYEQKKDFSQALSTYEKCLKKNDHHSATVEKLAYVHYQIAYEKIIAVKKMESALFQKEGQPLLDKIQYHVQQSIIYHEKMREKNSEDLTLLYNLKVLYQYIGDTYHYQKISNKIFNLQYQ